MWTRRELKTKGKAAFLANYWKTVLIALILAFIVGGAGAGAASGNSARLVFHNSGNTVNHVTTGGSSGVNVQWIDEEDAEILQELTDDRGDDVLLDVLRKRDIRPVGNGDAVAFGGSHLQDVPHLVQGEAHDVEAASEIGNGCRRENPDFFHRFIRWRRS